MIKTVCGINKATDLHKVFFTNVQFCAVLLGVPRTFGQDCYLAVLGDWVNS